MTQVIIISIKYAVILLMTYYTYASFRGIKNIKTEVPKDNSAHKTVTHSVPDHEHE